MQAKPGIDLNRIARAVDEEIARVKATPPTVRELERARTSLEADLIRSYESARGRAYALNQCYTFSGNPGCVDDVLARFRAVTPRGCRPRPRPASRRAGWCSA